MVLNPDSPAACADWRQAVPNHSASTARDNRAIRSGRPLAGSMKTSWRIGYSIRETINIKRRLRTEVKPCGDARQSRAPNTSTTLSLQRAAVAVR